MNHAKKPASDLSKKRREAALSGWRELGPEARAKRTAKARATRLANLMAKVDPEGRLPDEDRVQAARELQRIELAAGTLRSAVLARQRRAEAAASTNDHGDAPSEAPVGEPQEGQEREVGQGKVSSTPASPDAPQGVTPRVVRARVRRVGPRAR